LSKEDRSLTNQVAWQGFYYVASFYATWIFASLSRVVQMTTGDIPYVLLILFAFTLPGQGLWNFLVYIRPRYLRYLKEHPNRFLLCLGRCCRLDENTSQSKNVITSLITNTFSKAIEEPDHTDDKVAVTLTTIAGESFTASKYIDTDDVEGLDREEMYDEPEIKRIGSNHGESEHRSSNHDSADDPAALLLRSTSFREVQR